MFSAFLREKDIHGIAHNLRNDLQDIVLRDFPRLKGIFDILRRSGAKGELLSGSGSTVFGIFDREDIDAAANKVRSGLPRGEGWEVFVVNTY